MNAHVIMRRAPMPNAPRTWLRVDKAHVAKVIKARRALCVGEEVRA
jgi:hypothetical protein